VRFHGADPRRHCLLTDADLAGGAVQAARPGHAEQHFQRLRRSADIRTAPLLAASIFLDILNVFLFFLQIFSHEQ
jgi:hypothetical protein